MNDKSIDFCSAFLLWVVVGRSLVLILVRVTPYQYLRGLLVVVSPLLRFSLWFALWFFS